MRGRSAGESQAAFERVVALEPDHKGALLHLALLTAADGRDAELESLLTRLMAAHPEHTPHSNRMRAFALGDEGAMEDALVELRQASDEDLFETAFEVSLYMPSVAVAQRVAALLTAPERPTELRVAGHLYRAHLLLAQGRWAAARAELELVRPVDPETALTFRALFSSLPFLPVLRRELEALRDTLAATAAAPAANPYFELYAGPQMRAYLLGLLSARLREESATLGSAAALERDGASPGERMRAQILAAAVRARMAWTGGSAADALEALEQTRIEAYPPTIMAPGRFWIHGHQRHLWPKVLAALGREREALRWYDAFPWAADAQEHGLLDRVYEGPMHLWRAEIHDRLDEREQALEHYLRFTELWRDADPELRPMIERAERRLGELRSPADDGVTPLGRRRADELYLQARIYRAQRDGAGLPRAVELLEEAVRIAPEHGPAHGGLALAYAHLSAAAPVIGAEATFPRGETLRRANAAAARALRLDPDLVEAHLARALYDHWYEWDWAGAERAYRRAIALDPTHAEAHHWYALFLVDMNRPDEALSAMKRARELDPLSIVIHRNLGYVLYCARQWDEAIELFRATIELEPSWPLAHAWLRNALLKRDATDEAYLAHRRHAQLRGWSEADLRDLDRAHERGGWPAVWERTRLHTIETARRRPVAHTVLARLGAETGRTDEAFAWLERAAGERSIELLRLRVDPVYDPLRGDPRYGALMMRLGMR